MPQKDPSKTEKATGKRRKKAREEGQVAKSQDFAKAAMLVAGLYILRMYISVIHEKMMEIYTFFFTKGLVTNLDQDKLMEIVIWLMNKLLVILGPVFAALCVVAFLVMRLQVGKLWTTKNMKPKFKQVFNPINGLKKLMINPKMFIKLGKDLGVATVLSIVPYVVIKKKLPHILPLFFQPPAHIAQFILDTGYMMVNYTILPMLIIGIADLWYQFWDHEEQLKMSKDEVKDEQKQAMGDPKVKAQQKQKMMEFMAKRMMADVPKADVVITNPTHIAIAIMYDPMTAPAPLILAKGTDRLAERIKEVASEHNIPIRQNKPLAQALYKQVEVGDVIPEELYQAVAAILSKLNKFKGRYKAGN